MARQLRAGETSAVSQVQIAAATGLGGIGKTQLASELVHRYGRFFAGGVFWLNFADAAAVPVEVATCGRSLGLHSSFEALALEQQVRLVEEAWQSPLPRLLVFDNCEEEELLQRWRPRFGGARVLVTSRRAEWDPALGVKTIPLSTLPRPASIELLRRFRPDIAEIEPALAGISDDLGDLPLALHLAGSFLKRYSGAPFAQPAAYLESLREKDLLDHPSLQGQRSGTLPTGHEGHVGRTFTLSLERLDPTDHSDALAVALLTRAAWFSSGEPLPRALLLATVQRDSADLLSDLLAEDALRRLSDLGLLETSQRHDLLMHRLVAAWARSLAEDNEAQSEVEEAVLAEAARLNETRNPALLLAWRPHLRTVTDWAMERHDTTAARLCAELGVHLWYSGDYLGALPYLRRSLVLNIEVLGQDHEDTAKSLNIMGGLLSDMGDFSGGRAHLVQSLAIREKLLGLEHSDTARSLNDVGLLLIRQGEYRLARDYCERSLAIREKVLGPEHPATAISAVSLGLVLQNEGDLAGALLLFERALAINENMLGPEHPDTLTVINNIGSILKVRGDLPGARRLFERLLAIEEKVWGSEHPNTSAVINNLGTVLQDQGDLAGARRLYERALIIDEKVWGPEHPDTIIDINNLGSILRDLGDLKAARLQYERALAISERVLGPEHPDTAKSVSGLGIVLQSSGNLAGACDQHKRALAIREKALGPEHPDTAKSMLRLGKFYFNQGKLALARRYLERALQIFKVSLGPDHSTTTEARRALSVFPGARRINKQRQKKA